VISKESGRQSVTTEGVGILPRLILRDEDNHTLILLLRFIQRMLVQNPAAVRAIVQAIVAEGKRFAKTTEGQRWKETLTRSELMQRGRLIWQAYGLDSPLDTGPVLVPSDWLELLIHDMEIAGLETVLSLLMKEGARYGTISTP